MIKSRIVLVSMWCAIASGAPSLNAAQSDTAGYPNKPIRWVIPFAAGGGTDVIARPIAQKMSDRLGQSIVYEAHIKAGRLRGVAGASLKRIEVLPDLPTLHDSRL